MLCPRASRGGAQTGAAWLSLLVVFRNVIRLPHAGACHLTEGSHEFPFKPFDPIEDDRLCSAATASFALGVFVMSVVAADKDEEVRLALYLLCELTYLFFPSH